jgi:hypothetical protein
MTLHQVSLRVDAWNCLTALVAPTAGPTRGMLLTGWPEAGSSAVATALATRQPPAVRAAAIRWLAVGMAMDSTHAVPGSRHQPDTPSSPPDRPAKEQRCEVDGVDGGDVVMTEAGRSNPWSPGNEGVARWQARLAQLAGGGMATSVRGKLTSRVWDFGVDCLLARADLWEGISELLFLPPPKQSIALPELVSSAAGLFLQVIRVYPLPPPTHVNFCHACFVSRT